MVTRGVPVKSVPVISTRFTGIFMVSGTQYRPPEIFAKYRRLVSEYLLPGIGGYFGICFSVLGIKIQNISNGISYTRRVTKRLFVPVFTGTCDLENPVVSGHKKWRPPVTKVMSVTSRMLQLEAATNYISLRSEEFAFVGLSLVATEPVDYLSWFSMGVGHVT